jgi:SAM-dependent methyltransferase
MLQHEQNEQLNPVNRWLHSRRYELVRNWLQMHYGHKTVRILEIGVGYGRLFDELNPQLQIDYTGIELIEDLYKEAKQRHTGQANCRFILGSVLDSDVQKQLDASYDVIIALETCEHIPARNLPLVFDLLRNKLHCAYFISSVPIEIGPTIFLKNAGSWLLHYGRFREYSARETLNAALSRIDKLPPHSADHAYPRHKGFDWRSYRYLLHQDFVINQTLHLPLGWLPACLSTNVMFIAQPRKKLFKTV